MNNSTMTELFKRTATGLLLLFAFGGSYLHSSTLFLFFLTAVTLLVLLFEWPLITPTSGLRNAALTLIYPTAPFAALLFLTTCYYTTDFYLPLYPFVIAWSADTCGYIIGKIMGKHKICPQVSPGKSWEGLAGSCIGVFIINTFFLPRIQHFAQATITTNLFVMATFSIIMTAIAFLGGFLLSYLKRKKNLKDAGSILPGHGGFLDRFDGVLFTALATLILIFVL